MTSVGTSEDRAVSDADQVPSRSAKLAPACAGFVVGIVFWHCIGFWSLVSDMVFNGPRPRHAAVSSSAGSNKVHPTTEASIPAVAKPTPIFSGRTTCTTISQERPGGLMRRVPCPIDLPVSSFEPVSHDSLMEYDTSYDTIETGGILHGTSAGLRTLRENRNEASVRGNDEQRAQGWSTSLSVTTGPAAR